VTVAVMARFASINVLSASFLNRVFKDKSFDGGRRTKDVESHDYI
jgi:hypothetical protein